MMVIQNSERTHRSQSCGVDATPCVVLRSADFRGVAKSLIHFNSSSTVLDCPPPYNRHFNNPQSPTISGKMLLQLVILMAWCLGTWAEGSGGMLSVAGHSADMVV